MTHTHAYDSARRDEISAPGRPGLLVGMALVLIVAYQTMIRPFLIGSCKFCPSCSEYAAEALRRHGLLTGARLAARRLLRCHPFSSAGGYDPVPKRG